jgi:uncharacterized membrane protein
MCIGRKFPIVTGEQSEAIMSQTNGFSTTGATTVQKPAWPQHLLLSLTLVAGVASLFVPARQSAPVDAFLLMLAASASVAILTRQLPLQSVLFAAFITGLIGGAAHGLSARTGLPFGPVSFGEMSGPQLFNCVPWLVPVIWVVAIFSSRGTARLMLRPWRKMKNYGFLLMAVTAGLALAFDFALEPFARVKHLWLWQPTKISITWQGATPMCFLGWMFVTLLILAVIMPYLIRKQPGSTSAPNHAPAALWLGAMILFGINAAQAGLWLEMAVDGILAAAVAFFGWRGAKW